MMEMYLRILKVINMLSKYNPMSKEFQKEIKRLGLTGNQYIRKLREEGKLPNPSDRKEDIIRGKELYRRMTLKEDINLLV
jgi:hypothetical protein